MKTEPRAAVALTTPTDGAEVEPAVMHPSTPRLGRVAALDGIRGLAVLLVVMSHFVRRADSLTLDTPGGLLHDTFDGGYLGVDIFFVLSGFLITSLLLGERRDHGRVRFGAFYARRALRLLPALYAMLAVNLVYIVIARREIAATLWTSLAAIFYVNNWQGASRPASVAPGLGHLWSLSVEEQFYLLWPAILIGFLALSRRVWLIVPVFIALVDIILINRIGLFQHEGWLDAFVRTDARADSLLIGALASWLWLRGYVPVQRIARFAPAALVLVIAFVVVAPQPSKPEMHRGGFTLFALLVAFVILGVLGSSSRVARVFEWRPLCALGVVSYGLYLWHLPVFSAVRHQGGSWPVFVRSIAALGLTALFTLLSWHLVERPAARRRRRFEIHTPERAATPDQSEQAAAARAGPSGGRV